jgi:uncharacterized protein (DUF697 family)
MKLSLPQAILASVVSAMWTASFFIPDLDASARVGAQAAMMLVLGAVFGFQLVKRGNGKKDS